MNWTENENEVLRQYYHVLDRETLIEILDDRTINEIITQVGYLKRRGDKFYDEF